MAQRAGRRPGKVHRRCLPFLLCANATVRATCKEHDEMRNKRLAVVRAQHARRAGFWRAASGELAWRRATRSSRRCRFLVGARYIVPGVNAWQRAVYSRITIRGARNASHASPLAISKSRQITRHTMPSNSSRNSMKTKDRAPKEVTHYFSAAHSALSAFQGPRR